MLIRECSYIYIINSANLGIVYYLMYLFVINYLISRVYVDYVLCS